MRPSKQARVHRRWREQAARLVALVQGGNACRSIECAGCHRDDPDCRACGGEGSVLGQLVVNLLSGGPFDVARVRSYCERIIADAAERAEERLVFIEWTRDRGLGPENRERFAFHLSPAEITMGFTTGRWARRGLSLAQIKRLGFGGWPGPLAREWGWEKCKACEGKGRVHDVGGCERCEGSGRVTVHEQPLGAFELPGPGPSPGVVTDCPGCHGRGAQTKMVRCEPCRGRGRVRRKGYRSDAAAGPGLARTAQRLLDTLDGRCPWAPSAEAQASKCPRKCVNPPGDGHSWTRLATGEWEHGKSCKCDGLPRAWSLPFMPRHECPECRGTGHNLSGVLPEVEWSPSVHRKVHDSHNGPGFADHPEAWTYGRDYEGTLLTPQREDGGCSETRVVPRGEHRRPPNARDLDGLDRRGFNIDGMWPADLARFVRIGEPIPYTLDQRLAWREFIGDDKTSHFPRWRRGEWRHAEQRRRRQETDYPGVRSLVDQASAAARRFAQAHSVTPAQASEALNDAIANRTPPGAEPRDIEVFDDGSVSVGYVLPGRIQRLHVSTEFALGDDGPPE